jgi:hypothetical protein
VGKGRNALGSTNPLPANLQQIQLVSLIAIGCLRKQKITSKNLRLLQIIRKPPEFFYECILLPVFAAKSERYKLAGGEKI